MRMALRRARLQAGLTQAELAWQVGMVRASYTNIEKGYKNPSLLTALLLANILEKSVEELFADELTGGQLVKSGLLDKS